MHVCSQSSIHGAGGLGVLNLIRARGFCLFGLYSVIRIPPNDHICEAQEDGRLAGLLAFPI
jgi:hypothetical protein